MGALVEVGDKTSVAGVGVAGVIAAGAGGVAVT